LGNRKPLPQHGKLNPALSLKCQSILQKKSCAARQWFAVLIFLLCRAKIPLKQAVRKAESGKLTWYAELKSVFGPMFDGVF
jgi:hypothetical protein